MSTNPIILYANELPNAASITVTSEAAGYPKENAYDYLPWDAWMAAAAGTVYYTVDMGSAVSMDAWGAFRHTLGTNGASIQAQYSTTGAFAGEEVNVGSAVSPSSTEPFLRAFGAVSARYWRFKIISASAASEIAGIFLGTRMDMQEGLRPGYVPDTNKPRYSRISNVSEAGNLLGGSSRKMMISGILHFDLLDRSWIETNWEPFVRHFESGKGWLYCADIDNYPNEVSYCVYDNNARGPLYQDAYFGAVDVPYKGIVD